MLISIDEIRPKGLVVDVPLNAGFFDVALAKEGADTGFRGLAGSRLRASLSRVSGSVLLKGGFEATVGAPCKRCLLEVSMKLPVAFTLNLVPRDRGRDDAAASKEDDEGSKSSGSFELDQADQEIFSGKTIDLDPILHEQLLLALPMNVVCKESCRGLCTECGQNLNEGDCGHETKVVDPRLRVLKDIKLN